MIAKLFCRLGLHAWAMNKWGLPYFYCPHCGIAYTSDTATNGTGGAGGAGGVSQTVSKKGANDYDQAEVKG